MYILSKKRMLTKEEIKQRKAIRQVSESRQAAHREAESLPQVRDHFNFDSNPKVIHKDSTYTVLRGKVQDVDAYQIHVNMENGEIYVRYFCAKPEQLNLDLYTDDDLFSDFYED